MAKALKGTSSVFMVFIAPNDEAAAGVRIFFENHIEFMKEKSHQQGPLKLIQSTYSESPEWQNDGPYIAGPASFFEGEFPAKTGRTVFVLSEIYENENGLHHHYVESKDFISEFDEMISTYGIEFKEFNQMKITQSLWD